MEGLQARTNKQLAFFFFAARLGMRLRERERGGGRQTEHRKSACGEDRQTWGESSLSVVGRVLCEYRNAFEL